MKQGAQVPAEPRQLTNDTAGARRGPIVQTLGQIYQMLETHKSAASAFQPPQKARSVAGVVRCNLNGNGKRHVPQAGLLVLPRTGHALNLEEAAAFNQAVREFFAVVERDRWYVDQS